MLRRGTRGFLLFPLLALLLVPGSAIAAPSQVGLTVVKTATGNWTRTFSWDIDKSVNPSSLDLPAGGSGTADWTVSLTKSSPVERRSVSGDLCH